jgi:hypothetical protein
MGQELAKHADCCHAEEHSQHQTTTRKSSICAGNLKIPAPEQSVKAADQWMVGF